MKKIIFAVIGLLISASSFAQTVISGTVTDNLGDPIPGANILIVGSTSGTTSDFDGNFSNLRACFLEIILVLTS